VRHRACMTGMVRAEAFVGDGIGIDATVIGG
jgi:hypothetical protein